MKIKRKIYWNLCLVALLAMAVSALITALLLCQDLQTQMRHSVMTEVRYLESAMEVSGEDYLAPLKSRGDGNSENRMVRCSTTALQTVKALKIIKIGRRSLRHSKTAVDRASAHPEPLRSRPIIMQPV